MNDDEKYSAKETERRRDEVIRRMVNTPPQHKPTIPHPIKKKKAGAGRAVRKARAGHEG
jgi:hypothetical protein